MADLVLVHYRLGLIRPFIYQHVIHPVVAASVNCPPIGRDKCVAHLRLILELLARYIYVVASFDPGVTELFNPARVDLALPLR